MIFRLKTGFAFLVSIISLSTSGQSYSDVFLVPVTSRPSSTLRLQFTYQNDSVLIYGTNLAALPIALKKAKFLNPKVKLNFENSTAVATSAIEANYGLQMDTSLGFRSKRTGQSYYSVLKKSFLEGEGNSPIFINQNIPLGGFPAPPTWPLNFSATISGAGIYTVTYLPAISQDSLPMLNTQACEPVTNQFVKIRATQGYGLEKFTYKPYNARKRETVRKSFDIFFESGSAQAKGPELKAAIEYLSKNKSEILNATMEGGLPMEGDEMTNKKLQRARARVISVALTKYQKGALKKDTILLTDHWPKFREQIKASTSAWLDTLSNEKILKEINRDEKLRKGLEPILKTQRKASLNLTLAKVLSADDQFVVLQKSLNGWLRTMTTSKQPVKELEPQIMGAIAYLFEQHMNNVLNGEELDSLLYGDYMDHKYAYLGIHIVKQFTENKFGAEDKNEWKSKWDSLQLEPWFWRAQESLARLAVNPKLSKPDLSKFMKTLTDFQAFSYRLIKLGVLDSENFCRPFYIEEPEYFNLILNQYAFVYEWANEKGIETECVKGRISLLGLSPMKGQSNLDSAALTKPLKRDSSTTIAGDSLFNFFSIGNGLKRTGFEPRKFTNPSFSKNPKGLYYNLMKQGFLKGNRNVLSSATGKASLDGFSLFNFLDANVNNWDPEKNYFLDSEIRLEDMDRLISLLKKDNIVCAAPLNSLFLNYHQKALRFLELYFEPGSSKHKDIAEASLKFITDYYKTNLSGLKSDDPLKIALYLNHFNWFPGNSEGAWYGYDLITALGKTRKLNDEELRLWVNYTKIYDPEMKMSVPIGYGKESLINVRGY